MELNRNQFFLIGLVILLIGVQFRMVDSFVLTPTCTKILAERTGHPMAAAIDTVDALTPSTETVAPAKKVIPPEWLGWSLLSIGSVLILHSMAMKRPE
ncbi:MAG: hypothetical protein JW818_05145 [Pirellulales bacterium]|nr:hypothetical protein [Pirellulales bacterium]